MQSLYPYAAITAHSYVQLFIRPIPLFPTGGFFLDLGSNQLGVNIRRPFPDNPGSERTPEFVREATTTTRRDDEREPKNKMAAGTFAPDDSVPKRQVTMMMIVLIENQRPIFKKQSYGIAQAGHRRLECSS